MGNNGVDKERASSQQAEVVITPFGKTLFDRICDPSGVDSGEVPARDTLVGPE